MGVAVDIGLAVILCVSAWLTYRHTPPFIPLHYSRPWGVAQVVPKEALLFIAGLGAISSAAHVFLAEVALRHDAVVAQIVIWSETLLLLLLLLAVSIVLMRVGPS